MAAFISEQTGLYLMRSAGAGDGFLWEGQQRVAPSLAAVLVELPRSVPGEASGATGEIHPGPQGSEELWQRAATAILESFTLA